MKKTMKAFVSSILVFVMLFGTVSASAVELVTAGFTPEETGYYISASSMGSSYITVADGEKKVYLSYLESGKDYYYYGSDAEFLGAEINRISATDPSAFNNLILSIDVEEGATSVTFDIPVGIVFDSKTVYTYSTTFVCDDGFVAGENEVKYKIPAYEETKTINVRTPEEVFKTVDINSYYTSAFVDYKGGIFVEDISNARVVINGSQEIIANEYAYFVYSSRKYPLSVERVFDDEGNLTETEVYITGELGKIGIAVFDCQIVEASDSQNIIRATAYAMERVEVLEEEMIEKYSAYPLYLQNLLLPVMMCEMGTKGIGILFDQIKDIIYIYTT